MCKPLTVHPILIHGVLTLSDATLCDKISKNGESAKHNSAVVYLSHNVASKSDKMPINKIDKPLLVYRFSNVTQLRLL